MQMSARAVAQKRETEMRSCMLSSSVEIAANLHKTVFFVQSRAGVRCQLLIFALEPASARFIPPRSLAQLNSELAFSSPLSLSSGFLYQPNWEFLASSGPLVSRFAKKEIFGAALMNQNAAVCALADSNFNLVCYSYCFSSAISKRVINLV